MIYKIVDIIREAAEKEKVFWRMRKWQKKQ